MPAPGCWVTGSPRTSFRAPPEPPLRPTPGCSATASRRPAASTAGLRSATACWLPGPLRSLAGGAARGALAGLLRSRLLGSGLLRCLATLLSLLLRSGHRGVLPCAGLTPAAPDPDEGRETRVFGAQTDGGE